jgi:2,4-dienoyl-CoA reductase-like NADH-dependent reductase (Old Yellow Enzyme family)
VAFVGLGTEQGLRYGVTGGRSRFGRCQLWRKLPQTGDPNLSWVSGSCNPLIYRSITEFHHLKIHLSEGIKKAVPDIKIGAVGLILNGKQTNDYFEEGKADVIFIDRELMRDPHFVSRASLELKAPVNSAVQYQRAWTRLWKYQNPS